jgi:hypothetical protein
MSGPLLHFKSRQSNRAGRRETEIKVHSSVVLLAVLLAGVALTACGVIPPGTFAAITKALIR